MAMVRGNAFAAVLTLVVALDLVARVMLVQASSYLGTNWVSGRAHATFYGGADASGTQGVDRSIMSVTMKLWDFQVFALDAG